MADFFEVTLGNAITWLITLVGLFAVAWATIRWQKKEQEKKAAEMKLVEDAKAQAVKQYSEAQNKEVVRLIGEVNSQMTEMIDDLRKRADMTNGNVAAIRTDIADLQEDVLDLFENTDEDDTKEKKRAERERRERRRKIERDRIAQAEQK